MKLLLLDYISYTYHMNFNRIHVEALLEMGHQLHLVGRRGQFDNIEKNADIVISEIPERFFSERPLHALSFRLQGIARLFWVKSNIQWDEYDAVIVLTYDILSLSTFRIKQHTYLINHINVQELWSKLKLFLTRKLPKNYIHVALNQEMERKLKELLPGKIVCHIPHGVCSPSGTSKRPAFLDKERKFLICPVNRNYDPDFVKQLFENPRLLGFLREQGVTLLVKESMKVRGDSDLVVNVPADLGKEEYNYMIQNAAAVLLPYEEAFKYRCSGIFFECVANQTPVISTDIEAMRIYESMVEMRVFSDIDGLIDAIAYYLKNTPRANDLSAFNPIGYWARAFDNTLA